MPKYKGDPRSNSKAIKPYPDYYYLVHIERNYNGHLRIKVIKKHWRYRKQLVAALERVIPKKNLINFEILKGDEVLYYGLKFRNSIYYSLITKHDYPIEFSTKIKLKRFRTQSRRLMAKGITLKAEDYNHETKEEIQERARRKKEKKER